MVGENNPLSRKAMGFLIFLAVIMVTILIPTLEHLFEIWKRGQSKGALRTLAESYNVCLTDSRRSPTGGDVYAVAGDLARRTEIDASVFFIAGDPAEAALRAPLPRQILANPGNPGSPLADDWEGSPIAYALTSGLSSSPNLRRPYLPVAWTRGLDPEGNWKPDNPWRGAVGDVVFLDLHVETFKTTAPDSRGRFYRYGHDTRTRDIRKALNVGAEAHEYVPPN